MSRKEATGYKGLLYRSASDYDLLHALLVRNCNLVLRHGCSDWVWILPGMS